MEKRLYKSKDDRILFGVCGGVAEYFDVDPTLIRLAFVLILLTGTGLIAYIIAAIVMPEKPIVIVQSQGQTKAPKPEDAPRPEEGPQAEPTPQAEAEEAEEEVVEAVEDKDVTIE